MFSFALDSKQSHCDVRPVLKTPHFNRRSDRERMALFSIESTLFTWLLLRCSESSEIFEFLCFLCFVHELHDFSLMLITALAWLIIQVFPSLQPAFTAKKLFSKVHAIWKIVFEGSSVPANAVEVVNSVLCLSNTHRRTSDTNWVAYQNALYWSLTALRAMGEGNFIYFIYYFLGGGSVISYPKDHHFFGGGGWVVKTFWWIRASC